MRKIGILGGTFNPIHIGHLLMAQHALEACNLDEIWFVPTGCSYLKQSVEILSPEERFHMLELAISNNQHFKVCDIEIKREGYTYTYETLELLKNLYPEDSFYFIIGGDCLNQIQKWKNPQRIFDNCTVIATVRSGIPFSDLTQKKEELITLFHGNIVLLPFLLLEISSTQIRDRLRENKSVRYMVPDVVIQYIEDKKFYKKDLQNGDDNEKNGSEKNHEGNGKNTKL